MNPIWNMGLASSRCPKWPGHSAILAVQVSHFNFRSIVPSRGSLKPAVFGLPPNIVSLCSICTTDICLCKKRKARGFRILIHRHTIKFETLQPQTERRFQFLFSSFSSSATKNLRRKKKIKKRGTENYNLVGAEYAELDPADLGDLARRERESQIHGDPI